MSTISTYTRLYMTNNALIIGNYTIFDITGDTTTESYANSNSTYFIDTKEPIKYTLTTTAITTFTKQIYA